MTRAPAGSADGVTGPAEPATGTPSFRAVLFDLDGVLIDSLRIVERAWTRWAQEQDISAAAVLAVIHGRTAREVIGMVTPHLDVAEQVLRVSGYEMEGRGELTVVPGARECVRLASQRRWAVVTSGTREQAVSRLTAVGLPVPEILVAADDVVSGKPDPEPYQKAAGTLGVPAAECVAVEDAPMGVLAAKRAGMTVLAVTTSHKATALTDADQVFPTMREVTRWLRARPSAD